MKILTNSENILLEIGTEIIETDKYITISRIDGTNVVYLFKTGLNIINVDAISQEVKSQEYCYTSDKGFYKNTNYIPYVSTEEEIKQLKQSNETFAQTVTQLSLENADLKTQVQTLSQTVAKMSVQ